MTNEKMEQERIEQEMMEIEKEREAQEKMLEAIKNYTKKNMLKGAEVIWEKEHCKILVKKLCDNVTRKITYKLLLDNGLEVIDCGDVTRKTLMSTFSKSTVFRFLYDYDCSIEEIDLKSIANNVEIKYRNLEKIEVTTKISEDEVIYKIYSAVKEQNRSFEKGYCPILISDFKEIVSKNIEEYKYDDVKRILKRNDLLKTAKGRAFDDNERMPGDKNSHKVIKLKAIA